jgi:hypothetical protein
MSAVQLLLEHDTKAAELAALLEREGFHVTRSKEPDYTQGGSIVADRLALERWPSLLKFPERVVLIAPNDQDFLSKLWQHNMRSVVFESDAPGTVLLAVVGAEIGTGTVAATPPPSKRNFVVIGSR